MQLKENLMALKFILLAVILSLANAFTFDIGAGKEECFYEDVHQGSKINGAFAVTDGASRDIDVIVTDPRDAVVYEARKEGEGKFAIVADQDGSYKFCFSNRMSSVAHKTVKIAIDTGELPDFEKLAKKEHLSKVEQQVLQIAKVVEMVGFHQDSYRALHDRHIKTVKDTNSRVKFWSFLECIAVFGVSALQIFIIKRMFTKSSNNRRIV